MIITGKRIRSINSHMRFVEEGKTIHFGRTITNDDLNTLEECGFTLPPVSGQVVLPASSFGPVSRFNAEGKEDIHKNLPKETHFRQIEWTHKEFRGRYDRVEVTNYVDMPYERYPRTFIDPPSVELMIVELHDNQKVAITPPIEYRAANHTSILHQINLVLEIFDGHCEVFGDDLNAITMPEVRKLNWTILPQGKMPWSTLQNRLKDTIEREPKGNQPVVKYRFEKVNTYQPDFAAIGRGGFSGYVVFGFPSRNLFVFESTKTNNATYIFENNWESLSKLSKAEILSQDLQKARVIHDRNWSINLEAIMGPNSGNHSSGVTANIH